MGADLPEAAHVLAAYEELADADIIHDHTLLGPLLAARRGIRRPPVVTTVHGPFTRADPPDLHGDRDARFDRGDLAVAGPRLR